MGTLVFCVLSTEETCLSRRKRGLRRYEPVRRGVILALVYVADATDNDGANGPEHLQHLSSRGSQLDGHDLAAVCRCVGDEDAPRHAFQKLADEHDGQRLGKVEDEDEGVQQHEAEDGGPAVSDAVGEGPGEADANDGTERAAHLERRLPRCDNLPVAIFIFDAVLLLESIHGDESAHEEDAVGLHNLTMVVSCDSLKGRMKARWLTIVEDMMKAQKVAIG